MRAGNGYQFAEEARLKKIRDLLKEVIYTCSESVIQMMKSSISGCCLPKQEKECLKQEHPGSSNEKFNYLHQSI